MLGILRMEVVLLSLLGGYLNGYVWDSARSDFWKITELFIESEYQSSSNCTGEARISAWAG